MAFLLYVSSYSLWERQFLRKPCHTGCIDKEQEEEVDDPTDPHEDMLTDHDWQHLENHNGDDEEELLSVYV